MTIAYRQLEERVNKWGRKRILAILHHRSYEEVIHRLNPSMGRLRYHEPAATSNEFSKIAGRRPIDGPEHNMEWTRRRATRIFDGSLHYWMPEVQNLAFTEVARVSDD